MKTITGYFKSAFHAQKVYTMLKKEGFKDVDMDIIDRFPKSTDANMNGILSGDIGSLSNLILKPGEGEIPMEYRPLYAADPSVSGMGKFSEITDANIIVTVVVDEKNEKKVIEMITENEGEI